MSSCLANGIANQSDLDAVSVEILNTKQKRIELESSRQAYLSMLSIFIGKEIASGTTLEKPADTFESTSLVNNRPELRWFDAQGGQLNVQESSLKTRFRPRFGLFVQGAYGNPGLNMLKDDFSAYYVAGVRMSWNFGSLYTLRNDRRLIDNNRRKLETSRDVFLFNTNLESTQQSSAIQSMRRQMVDDDEIIRLRVNIRKTSDPYMFGSNPVIGVKPADEYQFRMFCTPVGPYFKGGAKPITIKVSDFDRAAPHGTGHIKAGLNYAMSLHAIVTAHQEGYDENMYLDAATRTKVEETGGANFIFVTKDGTVVTPKSNSILPSITRRSLMVVAEKYLGLKVEHREVYFDEVKDFAECGLCGTAAVISPVGKIVDHGKEICFPSGMEKMGPVIQKLYDTLTGIQMGRIEAPEGWIKEIKVD